MREISGRAVAGAASVIIGTAGERRRKMENAKNAGTVGWFKECVHRSRNGMFSEVKTVTPGLAEVILSSNQDNRNVRSVKLAQMVSDMVGGKWALNGESIIISDTGELNDGQHRLMALIAAKKCLPLLFTFGAKRETRITLDQGANRSSGDYLHMTGVPYASAQAANRASAYRL